MNIYERTIDRIDAAESRLKDEDCRVLFYIRSQLTPERVAQREELEAGGEKHLLEVANTRLRSYETEVTHAKQPQR